MLVAAGAGVVFAVSRHTAASGHTAAASGQRARGSQSLRGAAAIRAQAVSWVLQQVDRSDIVSCDPLVCAALTAYGFPAGNLLVLGSGTPNPLGSAVVIATPAVRSQFGSDLQADYAPAVLASFGSGSSRIDIRVVASTGARAYQAALAADLAAREAAGTQLLRNPRLTVSPVAAIQLAAGQVDSRLLTTLAQLTALQPVHVVAFSDSGAGASAGMPLRAVDLAQADRRAAATGGAYLRAMLAFLHNQRGNYLAARITSTLLTGQPVLQIQFAAPETLGLLGPHAP